MQKLHFNKKQIAPCGINCGVCIAHLRTKDQCSGCRERTENKPNHCVRCIIINCKYLANTESGFCYDCPKYPCKRLQQLDARYRKNYNTSLIGNLLQIQNDGIQNFLQSETLKWTCSNCNKIMSIHRNFCINCKQSKDNK